VPVFVGEFHELAGRRAAGVIDDDVQSAEVLCAVVNEAPDVLRLGHIRDHDHHLSAGFPSNHLGGLVQRRLPAGTDADLRTLARQPQGSGSSPALAPAPPNRDPTLHLQNPPRATVPLLSPPAAPPRGVAAPPPLAPPRHKRDLTFQSKIHPRSP